MFLTVGQNRRELSELCDLQHLSFCFKASMGTFKVFLTLISLVKQDAKGQVVSSMCFPKILGSFHFSSETLEIKWK